MKIAYIGVGKLGLPCAMVAAVRHDAVGYDVSRWPYDVLASRVFPHPEAEAQEYLNKTTLRMVDSIEAAVAHGDLIFVAVQTPHGPEYEGSTRIPETRADFDYSYLKRAVEDVAVAAKKLGKKVVVSVISTVLPGTVAREIRPLLNEYTALAYNPHFIAMSTVIPDYVRPEFILLGADAGDEDAADVVREFYGTITKAPVRQMSVASAEATKVAYNSLISCKITIANTWMQICDATGANVDDVTEALCAATTRIISPKYLKSGMGDGGSCHPRDLIALSCISDKLGFTYNIFDALMKAREEQTAWLAVLAVDAARERGLQSIGILGKAFKAGTNMVNGSPAVLLYNLLQEHAWVQAGHPVVQWDPKIDPPREFAYAAAFVVATDHDEFYTMTFPEGSVVIDPWGKMRDREGVDVVRVGR